MSMHSFAFLNDSIVEYSKLHLHISDLGVQRGYAIFDFFPIKKGKIHWKEDYFDRFFASANLADLEVPLDRAGLEAAIMEIINKNESPDSYIKLLLTGGESENGYEYDSSTFSILNFEDKGKDEKSFEEGVNLISTFYQRPTPEIKTTNYFMSASLHKKRKEFNAVDVLYHLDGIVTETSRANFYIVRDEEIFTTDAAFITSTTKGVTPVVKIDGDDIAGGVVPEISKDIMSIFNPLT